MTSRPWLAGLALALAACGSSRSPSASRTTPSRGGPSTATRPNTAPRGPSTAPAATAPRGGRTLPTAAFAWTGSLEEARSVARSTNRLVFLEMGRDGCGNCEALKNKVIEDPSVKSEMGRLCVGWYDNVDRERATPARSVLYQNLPNAMVLPLVGWVTSDMRWISGYSGRRDAAGFSNEIAKARAIYLQRTAADRPVPERELVVEPEHGSLPDTELADVGAALGEDAIPVAAEVAVERTPFAEEGARLDSPVAAAEPPIAGTPPAPLEPETFTAPAPPPPVAPAPDPVRVWAHQELERAASALAARDYAGARAIIAEVRTRAQGLPEQREAEKGEVAIHLLKKIERQSGDEASKTRSDAARDLRGTVWVSLFA